MTEQLIYIYIYIYLRDGKSFGFLGKIYVSGPGDKNNPLSAMGFLFLEVTQD